MLRLALSKVNETHKIFKTIINPLKTYLNLSFGYMIVMKDGRYYKLMEDIECLEKFVSQVKSSSIFCARNVTNHYDFGYNFTVWPSLPTSTAMEIYHHHNIWNGISVSKSNKQHTEIYFFTSKENKLDWHKFYIRNKAALIRFIEYFNQHKELLMIHNRYLYQGMFKFSEGFNNKIQDSECLQKESDKIKRFVSCLNLNNSFDLLSKSNEASKLIFDESEILHSLTEKDKEIIAGITNGDSAKIIARNMFISHRTVEYHIEKIKAKTGFKTRSEIIAFFLNHVGKS
jgi:DNA-binding CsgD family transcriptional regulator